MKFLAIGLGGFLGAIARHSISRFTQSYFGSTFPWGTLAVNISGSFLIGVVYSIAAEKFIIYPHLRAVLLIGFIGSYTTFSAFSLETFTLMESGNLLQAAANVFMSLTICLVAVYSGTLVGRLV